MLQQLHRAVTRAGGRELDALYDEVCAYPNVRAILDSHRVSLLEHPPLLVPLVVELGGEELSLFTTLTTFGTPQDVTLDELAIELFFPADAHTEDVLRR